MSMENSIFREINILLYFINHKYTRKKIWWPGRKVTPNPESKWFARASTNTMVIRKKTYSMPQAEGKVI